MSARSLMSMKFCVHLPQAFTTHNASESINGLIVQHKTAWFRTKNRRYNQHPRSGAQPCLGGSAPENEPRNTSLALAIPLLKQYTWYFTFNHASFSVDHGFSGYLYSDSSLHCHSIQSSPLLLLWYNLGQEATMQSIYPQMPVTVLDFETTGFSPKSGHRVIEVGAVKVRQGQTVNTYESLVHFSGDLSPQITKLTGIKSWELMNAPQPKTVFTQLLDFIGNDAVVAHNASFEQRFLTAELQHLNLKQVPLNFYCTLKLARKYLPQAPNHQLETLLSILKAPVKLPLHRACNDALATVHLWLLLASLSAEEARK